MNSIEIEGLQKTYRAHGRQHEAVRSLDLHVPEGGVFGLLGPNGAGKSTILRCLLGLVRPDTGTMRILGHPVPTELGAVVTRIGSLMEGPAFHPGFSARENLEFLADLGGVPRASVRPVLSRLHLSKRENDPVKSYSLGMRQRLGIAAALLKDPEIVILDEPTNGLDPSGIAEMRLFVRELADEGRTVLLSSHLLTEVGQVADRVAILVSGRSVFNGTMGELLNANDPGYLVLRIDDPDAARAALTASGFLVEEEGGSLLRIKAKADEARIVGKRLAARGLFPLELSAGAADLEAIFLRLTSETELEHESMAG